MIVHGLTSDLKAVPIRVNDDGSLAGVLSIGTAITGGTDTQVLFVDGTTLAGDAGLTYNKTTDALTIGGNATLLGEAANVLAQRNGPNAQAFRIYNTFTDASNYERFNLEWSGNQIFFNSVAAGTGTVRNINFSSGGNTNAVLNSTSSAFYTAAGVIAFQVVKADGSATSPHPTGGIGYATGAGGTVTQITSRTTGVTLNKVCGQITLVSAAGSATYASFTVTNSAVAATDEPFAWQVSGTDLYEIQITAVAAGSFRITFRTTGGTTVETPVFGFAIRKAVTA